MNRSAAGNIRSIAAKMAMGFVLAAMIGSISVAPAIGERGGGHGRGGGGPGGRGHDNGRFEQRGHGYDRNHYGPDRRGPRPYGYGYGYRQRVYAPPPVIYAPPPPPGIGIFFPPIFIHP